MIAVDTNIVVRFLTKDDETQFQKSLKLFQEQNIFIGDTVILEVEWVLRFAYKFTPEQICQALRKLFGLPNTYISDVNAIAQVLEWHEIGLDFTDAFHLVKSQHCSELYTFEQKFYTQGQNLSLCKLQQA
ncbi:MAG: type II toxin-antitoxin system VapC family toxin [Waterburya sp.]